MDNRIDHPTRVLTLDRTRWVAYANVVVKASLVLAFAIAIIFEPAGVEGKGMEYRAPIFLGSAILVPLLARRRGWEPFPHTGDALLASPFLVDTLGNLFGFYDSFDATDDVLHLLNWVLLVGAFHAFRFRNVFNRTDALFLGYGFGAIAIIWWEIFEWMVSTDGFGGTGGLNLTYGDTVGDLLLSSTGGLVGSALGLHLLGPSADRARGRG